MGISRLSVKSALLIAAVSALGQTQSQKPAFLSDYLALHPWDAAKFGPMVVLSPERTSVRSSGTSLSAFDRKLIRVGSLTAIAPTEMVLIDDSLREPPNMCDGLPTNAKVLYLLSTLTEDQLKTANTNGIGLKDLQGEQQKVFRSLLPTVLSWGTYKVGEVGAIPGEKVDGGSVPDDLMDQVKVKIQSGISFEFKLLDQPNSYTGFSNRDWYGKPGDKVKVRTESDKDRRAHAFGLDPRRIVPNESKPSQLNYADPRLAAQLLLPVQSTVKGLLKDASAASGFEITADLRVRDLMVETVGARVKAGDLLKAIALCVTGTYRKVDSAFVLTSDIAGLGARKLKFCAWKESVDKELQRREGFWRERVFKSGVLIWPRASSRKNGWLRSHPTLI